MIGNTLSHYKIIEKLGQGGFGEVYLAEDSRLNRKVALKILPQHLSERAELRERFEREARAVSSLNHPHICTLHDIGEQDGIHYLVMEHLVGETLEARLAKGALPLEQTLEYAIQIADALDKAHRQGVVHRDLKPGNIMLVKSGAKLLDFGLAKLQAVETPTNLSALPTEQANLTAEGTILGTLQYMAPEQLEAKEADARTDIFAFGAVVYEMATGKKAFEGKSQASLIAAIMGQDPRPMSELQPMTPSTLDHVVRRCLAKEPDKRWQVASDVMEELGWVTEAGTSADSLPAAAAPAAWKKAIPWGIAVTAVIMAGANTFWSSPQPESVPLKKFSITLPPSAPLDSGGNSEVAVSRDGRHIVFVSENDTLYLRSLDNQSVVPISGTEGGRTPWFSPDGEWVAFSVAGKLKKVPLRGGAQMTLCDAPGLGAQGSWGPRNTIVFSNTGTDGSLYRVSAAGGNREILATPDPDKGEFQYLHPEILPDGKAVLFSVQMEDSSAQIAVVSLETGEQTTVLEDGGGQPHYTPTGHLVYAQDGTLMGVPFNLERQEVMGQPAPIHEGVRGGGATGSTDYALSGEGTLVYVPDFVGPGQRSLVWVDRKGESEPFTDLQRQFSNPKFSPNGARLAVTVREEPAGQNVWIYEMASRILTPFTFQAPQARSPIWTVDGKHLTFSLDLEPGGIFWRPVDGSREREQLTQMQQAIIQIPNSWSRDGVLAYSEGLPNNGDIWTLSVEGERQPQEFVVTEFNERHPMFSPNGRWIAFTSDQSRRDEIYVKAYPGPGGMVQISNEGGNQPLWARDGEELFYRNGDKMMMVSVQTKPTFKMLAVPRVLFQDSYIPGSFGWAPNYDLTPDGERFVMVKQSETRATQINIVLNWFEELKRLAPTDN